MTQRDKAWRRQERQSPCIQVCLIHPIEKICTGCFRTADEIAQWSRLSQEEQERILIELPSRAPRLKKRRGGRMSQHRRRKH